MTESRCSRKRRPFASGGVMGKAPRVALVYCPHLCPPGRKTSSPCEVVVPARKNESRHNRTAWPHLLVAEAVSRRTAQYGASPAPPLATAGRAWATRQAVRIVMFQFNVGESLMNKDRIKKLNITHICFILLWTILVVVSALAETSAPVPMSDDWGDEGKAPTPGFSLLLHPPGR